VPDLLKGPLHNPYPFLGCPVPHCWPRGFPLDEVIPSLSWNGTVLEKLFRSSSLAVLQSLADHEPDVDAIFRLTQGTPVSFQRDRQSLVHVLPHGVYSPYNAQATLHLYAGFFALFLPVTVAGRVSDIWRSYISQALFSLFGLHVGFLPRPLVTQDRNKHSLDADFEAEIPLYIKSKALVTFLASWVKGKQEKPIESFAETVEDLWIQLYEREIVELADVKLVQLWLQALSHAGYKFPGHEKTSGISTLPCSKLNFGVFSDVRTQITEEPSTCKYARGLKRRFWTSDLHDGTRLDTPTVLVHLKQKVVLAGSKGKKTNYPKTYLKPGLFFFDRLSDVVRDYNLQTNPTLEDMESHIAHYQNMPAILNTDAFVCSFPAAMCQLWLPFNKSVVFLPAHRYNLGRCSVEAWMRLNKDVVALSQSDRNLVGALSRYDLEYLKYYTGVSGKLVPSLSGYYTDGNPYLPVKKEILVFSVDESEMPAHFHHLIGNVTQIDLKPVREVYRKYVLSDLVSHPAIVLLPYSVMSYKLTEFYSLGIPLFVPSPRYFRQNGGLGKDRTSTSRPYCSNRTELNDKMPKHAAAPHPYSPNGEFAEDAEAEMYWLQFSDFYEWPHITYFDDPRHLEEVYLAADLNAIHGKMVEAYGIRRHETLNQWCDFIPNIIPHNGTA